MFEGRLAGIYTSATAGAPMESQPEVRVIAGVGLEGDRYATGQGNFSAKPGTGRQVTLVEQEAIAALRAGGVELAGHETRRNLVTEGVPLNHLVGRTFRVGDVVLQGVRLAEPCAYLASLTRPGVSRALVHRGGLRADVVDGGIVRVGDAITPVA
ncbi:MAG TPA: MOSC domain-containing protein [Acidimicrobiia bacterium]